MESRRSLGLLAPETMVWPFTRIERTMGGIRVRNRPAAGSEDTIRKCKRQLRGSCQQDLCQFLRVRCPGGMNVPQRAPWAS